MKNTRKLICTLIAGATLGAAGPVFADSFHDRGYGHDRHRAQFRDHDRYGYRDHYRYGYRDHYRHHAFVERPYIVQRPYIIEQPVYYGQPAPNLGIGAILGQAIGSYFDSRQ